MMRDCLHELWHTPLGWIFLIVVLCMAQTVGKHTLLQEDMGMYNAALSTPGTLSGTTLAQAVTDMGSNKRTIWLTQGTWTLADNLTIPANIQLYIPHGTTVTIGSGKTLTLAGCPKIDMPGWLNPGTTGIVKVTAPGCEIEVHKYAKGGDGVSKDTPWTGWEHVACQNTWGKDIHYRSGYYETAITCSLDDEAPYNSDLRGFADIHGDGPGNTVIMFNPTGAGSEFVPATGVSNVITWLSAGVPGKLLYQLKVHDLAVVSNDTTYKKRAFHFVDPRSSAFYNLAVGTGLQDRRFYDTTGNSIGFHVEGRGQNKYQHWGLIAADYPLIVDGTPNEGGICYSTQSGWTGTAGFCEHDTSTFEDISLEVRRYYFDPGDGVKKCLANPNILIGSPTTLHRTSFKQINMNGGSYGIFWHGIPQAGTSGLNFEALFWEDPCPLDPSTIGAGRIAAGVAPSTIVQPSANVYGDDAALRPASAWGYMLGFDLSGASSWLVQDLTIKNASSLGGGNGLSFHHFNDVHIDNFRFWGNGHYTHHYPGFHGEVTAATNANPGVLTITGHGLTAGTYSFPCSGFTGSWAPLNTTLTATYVSANTFSIGVNTSGFGALTGTPSCSVTPAPAAMRAFALDIDGVRIGGPTYTSYPVHCIGCKAGALTHVAISSDLDVVKSTPVNPIDYLSATFHNTFQSSDITWDSIRDTNPGAALGVFTWTPRLVDNALNEPTYTSRGGQVIITQIGLTKLVQFYGSIVVNSMAGMTGGDAAAIVHTNGNNWGTNTTASDVAVTIGMYGGITMAANFTQVLARIPAGDQRIVLTKGGSAQTTSNLLISEIGNGATIEFSGAMVIQE